jgi:hypothetical protein
VINVDGQGLADILQALLDVAVAVAYLFHILRK